MSEVKPNTATEQKTETDVRGPQIGFRPGPGPVGPHGMIGEKAKLEHSRNILWRWTLSYLVPFKWRYIGFLVLLLIGTAVQSYNPLLAASLINTGIIGGDPQFLLNISLIYLGLVIFLALANYVAMYGMNKLGQEIVYGIRNDLFNKLQAMSMGYFDRRPSGDIISVVTNDVDQVNMLVSGQLVQIVTSIVGIGLTIMFMFVANPYLALWSLIAFPIFYGLLQMFKRSIIGAFKETRKTISKVTSSIQENVAGAKVIQAFGQEQKAASEFDRANEENFQASFKARKIFATFFPLTQFATQLITVMVLVLGGFAIIGDMNFFGVLVSVGILSAFITYLAQFFQPFMTLMQIQNVIESSMAASDRIYGLLETPVEMADPEEPVPLTEVKGVLDFQDVSFGYKFEAPVAVKNNHTVKTNNYHEKGKPAKSEKPLQTTAAISAPETPIMPNVTKMSKMPGMPEVPGGINLMEMMQRAQEFLSKLPEPHRGFMQRNFFRLPGEIRHGLMTKLFGGNPKDAPATIDAVLAEHGFAVPDSDQARAHPDLKTQFPEPDPSQMPPFMQMMMGGAKPAAIPAGIQSGVTPNSSQGQKPPTTPMGGMPMDPEMIKRMIGSLEKMLHQRNSMRAAGPSSGMGAEGSMGGSMGGGMPGMNPEQFLRMLASFPIPEAIFKEFPEIVQKAIEEERVILERERTVGFVLKDINLHLDAGKTLAIVGETGAGKTTMIKLLARFYDVNKGKVLLDGVDVRLVKKNDLRRYIGLVPQDSFLFTGTIRENLLYGEERVIPENEAKMIDISKFLGLHNFIMAQPDGYDTILKENASNISIGQRQLIAFARALITDPKVLILDEATSSVDPYTETLIQDALNQARKGRSTIIIAHRLSTIKNADEIIVLSKDTKGIIEEGSHDELVAIPNGKYRRLLEMQYKDIESNGK